MPAWVITLLVKFALPVVLQYLQKSGAINSVEAWGVKTGTHVLAATKVENSFPVDAAMRGASYQPEPGKE